MRMVRWEIEEENLPRSRRPGARGHTVNSFQHKYLGGALELRSGQFGSEQEPGPRGSPQEPQAPRAAGRLLEDGPLAETANTESCGESFFP